MAFSHTWLLYNGEERNEKARMAGHPGENPEK
jgi:hypothetical protein